MLHTQRTIVHIAVHRVCVRAFDYQIVKEQIKNSCLDLCGFCIQSNHVVELIGVEPTTSGLQSRRSPN